MNDQCEAMLNVQRTDFVVHEIGLYLDTHPFDANALAAFSHAVLAHEAAQSYYEQTFGPLTQEAAAGADTWTWIIDPWPWEKE